MTHFLLMGSVIFGSVLSRNPDHWRSEIYWTSAAILFWISIVIARQFHWSAALGFFWASLSAIKAFFYPQSPYIQMGKASVIAFDSVTSQSLVYLMIAVIPFVLLKKKNYGSISQGFAFLCFIDSIIVLSRWILGDSPSGLMDNSALDACMIACTWSFLAIKPMPQDYDCEDLRDVKKNLLKFARDLIWICTPIAAIFATQSSTGLAAFAIAIAGSLFMRIQSKLLTLGAIFGIGWTALIVGFMTIGKDQLLNPNGRFAQWDLAMKFFEKKIEFFFGAGPGTYFILGPLIQLKNNPILNHYPNFYIYLHNDWMQILFELGCVGLALAGLVYLYSLRNAYKKGDEWVFSSLLAYGFVGLFQPPLRIMTFSCLGAFLLASAFNKIKNV